MSKNRLSQLTKIAVVVTLITMPVVTTAATMNASNFLSRTLRPRATLQWANKTVYKKLVKFKKAVRVLGTLTTKNLHVTGTATFDTPLDADQIADVQADDVTSVTVDNVQTGFVQYKIIEDDALQALMDGNANTALTFDQDDLIIDVIYAATDKADSGTVDIGVDENWSNLVEDGDGFFNDLDLTSAGLERTVTVDEASQATLADGIAVQNTTGDIIVQSSVDLTADAGFGGKLIVTYIRN